MKLARPPAVPLPDDEVGPAALAALGAASTATIPTATMRTTGRQREKVDTLPSSPHHPPRFSLDPPTQ